jgi:hypothetical protein
MFVGFTILWSLLSILSVILTYLFVSMKTCLWVRCPFLSFSLFTWSLIHTYIDLKHLLNWVYAWIKVYAYSWVLLTSGHFLPAHSFKYRIGLVGLKHSFRLKGPETFEGIKNWDHGHRSCKTPNSLRGRVWRRANGSNWANGLYKHSSSQTGFHE